MRARHSQLEEQFGARNASMTERAVFTPVVHSLTSADAQTRQIALKLNALCRVCFGAPQQEPVLPRSDACLSAARFSAADPSAVRALRLTLYACMEHHTRATTEVPIRNQSMASPCASRGRRRQRLQRHELGRVSPAEVVYCVH